MKRFLLGLSFLACVSPLAVADESQWSRLELTPKTITLRGPHAKQQLLVTAWASQSLRRDATRDAEFVSENPQVVRVDEHGLLQAVGDGTTTVQVRVADLTATVPVKITETSAPLPVDFERDVQPILTRFSCNAGACHGKARGQNGFQLSLLGFDPNFDYDALTKEARGRRVFLPDPSRSLLLTKPIARTPHGGGKRLDPEGEHFETLTRWVESGAPRELPGVAKLDRIEVYPTERILKNDDSQQLLVTAIYADGTRRDVTRLSSFQSNESAIAAVDKDGVVTAGKLTGDAAIMARFMDQITVSEVAVPLPGQVPAEFYTELPKQNFIDGLVWDKLQKLALKPSEPAPDHSFLRRVYIDIIGRTPTADEARAFLDDPSPNKRSELVDNLLNRPEFAEHWANKWVDLLRPNPYRVGIKNTLNYDYWIRQKFRENTPWDEFTRELLTAQGGTFRNGAVTLFRDRRSPDELTTMVSQLFLGVRLDCAKCHHHPFEVYGQDDFYSFAAYFAKIGRKGKGLSPPISGSEEIIYTATRGDVKHPLTGEVLPPKPLFGEPADIPTGTDPRVKLAEWITSDDNPFFAKVMANRIWADLMGTGIVEPVDDLRGTNPPANEPLLDALAEDFREHDYDIKHLVRRIANSYVYSLSSLPNDRNFVDTRNHSRYYRQRLRAEVLLDSVARITGKPNSFSAMPDGSLAKEIWTHRVQSDFLDAFGRPDPNQDPPCERTSDTTLVQALHLMNSRDLAAKITSDSSRVAELAASDKPPESIVEDLYLWVYARFPSDQERQIGVNLYNQDGRTRRAATEDLLWALLNTPEFVFKN
ncbi:DUF1549 domain-containing protein [Thalassoroseus pseudoceratinae]|uniref:DUF1549 domain-containing protein n=1 Tax=Thalassoroseus pseudoceratinae TaxID=2713176 RepID=UPI00141F5CA6|nr:DUF1549 domain-containing protein [Thalassoroseus pseudoceratinae]